MAGLVARLNQAKQKRVGFLNPFLYANAAQGLLREVTAGDNALTSAVTGFRRIIPGYQAHAGWNACAGLGTPDGTRILHAL
jgi:kumamolisin